MIFKRFNKLFIKSPATTCRAKGAIFDVAPGSSRNLSELAGIQATILPAIKFAIPRKGDVIDIKIQSHPNRISRNNVIDFA